MSVIRLRSVLISTLAFAVLPAAARAQKVGSEFQINTYTTNAQRADGFGGQVLAADANGNFVAFWRSFTQDGSSDGVFGQRYDSAGQRVGAEFRVNSFTTGRQGYPSAARAANGEFVVVWESDGQDGSSYGVFGQRFDAVGPASVGAEFRVNTYTTGHQRMPGRGVRRRRRTSSSSGRATTRTAAATASSASATTARAPSWGASSASTPTRRDIQRRPRRRLGRGRRLRRRLARATARTATATGSSASATTARASPRGSEFRVNTYTTPQPEARRPSPRTRAGTSSSSGTASRQDGSRLRDLRSALRQRGQCAGGASSRSTPTRPADQCSSDRRLRRDRELRRRLA